MQSHLPKMFTSDLSMLQLVHFNSESQSLQSLGQTNHNYIKYLRIKQYQYQHIHLHNCINHYFCTLNSNHHNLYNYSDQNCYKLDRFSHTISRLIIIRNIWNYKCMNLLIKFYLMGKINIRFGPIHSMSSKFDDIYANLPHMNLYSVYRCILLCNYINLTGVIDLVKYYMLGNY